jgi:hypothetical protein
MRRSCLIARDLQLYVGLFISPFILLSAVSVFFLVQGPPRRAMAMQSVESRTVTGVTIPTGAANLQGHAPVDAIRPVLDGHGVKGRGGFHPAPSPGAPPWSFRYACQP